MSVLALEKPYPTYALPPLVRNAIIETQKIHRHPGSGGNIRINSDVSFQPESG